MKILKTERFVNFGAYKSVAAFINENKIAREDILTIIEGNGNYTLYYYAEG